MPPCLSAQYSELTHTRAPCAAYPVCVIGCPLGKLVVLLSLREMLCLDTIRFEIRLLLRYYGN